MKTFQQWLEGYGPVKNGKQKPITPWKGSWAQQEEERKKKDKEKPQKPTNPESLN